MRTRVSVVVLCLAFVFALMTRSGGIEAYVVSKSFQES